MNKKILIPTVIVILALVVLFFYPKNNSVGDDHFTAENKGYMENKHCTCIGIEKLDNNCKSCTQTSTCYGLPISCNYDCEKLINNEWQIIACNEVP